MKKIFKIGCGTILGFFVLIVAIGLIFGEDTANESSKNTTNKDSEVEAGTSEKVEKEEEKEELLASIGEKLVVGNVGFTVNKIEEVSKITTANGYVTYKPESEGAVYLVLNVTVENQGNEMIQTTSSFFQLVSDTGAQYSPSTIITTDEKFFTFEGVNPGLSLTGNVLFEVPSGLTDLSLEVQTGFLGTEKGTIKLN